MTPRKHIRPSPERQQQIVAAIRAGSYPHIAAQAFGVPVEVFEDWLRRGRGARAREPYRSFALNVEEAHSQARLRAEVDVLQATPRIWLEHGPGRDRADDPGWSSAVKPAAPRASADALLEPEMLQIIHFLQTELASLPEMRERLSALLRQRELRRAA